MAQNIGKVMARVRRLIVIVFIAVVRVMPNVGGEARPPGPEHRQPIRGSMPEWYRPTPSRVAVASTDWFDEWPSWTLGILGSRRPGN
jgi:hypothetical protein